MVDLCEVWEDEGELVTELLCRSVCYICNASDRDKKLFV